MTQRPRQLDWRSGGWLLLLMAILVLAVVAWRVVPLLGTSSRAIGDGLHVESYGFSMAGLNVPRELVVAAGFPKDGMPALVDPAAMPGTGVVPLNESRRGKYVVTSDRVVGVILGGEARAYPVRLLNWHEVINDTLGGIPIAVTYHPLCDSVVVFDRRVDGETLEFGVSGLLFNSNQLLFDRRVDPTEEGVMGPTEEGGMRLHPDTEAALRNRDSGLWPAAIVAAATALVTVAVVLALTG